MKTLWYFIIFGLASVYSRDIYTSINWDPRNPIFKADGKNCGPGPRQLKVRLNSQIYLVCPNLPTVLQTRGDEVQTSNMKENIWLLHNKTAFDECDVSQVQVTQKTDFFICDDPTRLVFLSLLFLEHAAGMNDRTFVGGRTYYLIATSHGTQSSVKDLSGGHCNDTSKNVYMKVEVYVCNKTGDRICNSRNVGILTCPPPVTTAPYTSLSTTTLTHGPDLGINITESVMTDKKTRKCICENDEVVELRKTRNLWMTFAICFSCFAGVLLTVIVIFVVCNYCSGPKGKDHFKTPCHSSEKHADCYYAAELDIYGCEDLGEGAQGVKAPQRERKYKCVESPPILTTLL
ncbi:PREDICTED: uncharacterized protein LOC107358622 isoform X5 [Acropora digitifera]|uniref:uncharacterized protein LOC107358622 isoform X5 n=1 Tax=Acropora digitifera TaxID=70779 RepID=UPI00077B224B|nr:PREDICTED: uncharacterized protein LOC107358622 isoform X5 [Acropora digitifera]